VQPSHLTWLGAPQLQLQQVGEHLVVAEPGSLPIQGHHERVRPLQFLQDPLSALVPGQQEGQVLVHPLKHAGTQQEPPHLFGLPVQNLGEQVLRDGPFGAGEPRGEPGRVGVPGQGQRGQTQPRGDAGGRDGTERYGGDAAGSGEQGDDGRVENEVAIAGERGGEFRAPREVEGAERPDRDEPGTAAKNAPRWPWATLTDGRSDRMAPGWR
jgi:hypothetical protein